MGNRRRFTVLSVLALAAGVYGWHQWSRLHPDGITNQRRPPQDARQPPRDPGKGGPPMPPGVTLTNDQKSKLEELRKSTGNDPRAMQAQVNNVLTSDQRTQMQEAATRHNAERAKRDAERDARLKNSLNKQDYEAFKRRMEQMPPPPGGPPGGGPPPSRLTGNS